MTADRVVDDLRAVGIRRSTANEDMARHTSWRIGGPADYFCVVEDEAQLQGAIDVAKRHGLPWLVLGGGNNILISDAGIEGIVILNRLRGLSIENIPGESQSADVVACGAGVFFAKAAYFTAHCGYAGMEWGIAIPGTVGAGVVNNAGAHWADVSRTLVSATVADDTGRSETLTPSALEYRYRQSALKGFHITRTSLVVTACRFRVQPDNPEAALTRLEELRRHRLETQPVKEASAGSTFKNPPGTHAGALIDRAGLKGRRAGDAQIAPLHANFILNLGAARAQDVIALILQARARVHEEFDIWLEPEIQLVGRWADDLVHSIGGAAA